MNGINKVILVGTLGNDPESRTMPNGMQVTEISIATSEKWKDKQSGQMQERTEWHKASGFGRLAEIMSQYLRKGSKVYIEGKLKTERWEKDGVTRYTTKIIAREMQMLGDNNQGQSQQGQPQQQQQQRPQQQRPQQQRPQQQQQSQSQSFDDDDIPF